MDETTLTKQRALLQSFESFNSVIIREVIAYLSGRDSIALAESYRRCLQKRHVDLGFNIFAMISDFYYRETFHSDILAILIDPNGAHGHRDVFMRLFLAFISSRGAMIDPADYLDPRVLRERGRIDILIHDPASRRAIIVENKINNAVDQPRQLPGYLAYVEQTMGYRCDAIIYLRVNGYTYPDTSGWSESEKAQINRLLIPVCAYEETDKDLFEGWIAPCLAASQASDAKHIFGQYGQLIMKLGANIMNKPILERFYDFIVEGDNFQTALSLQEMLNGLVLFRVEKLIEHFRVDPKPFRQVQNYKNWDAYFTGLEFGEAHFGVDVIVEPTTYKFQFWDREDQPGAKGLAKAMLWKMQCLDEYILRDGRYEKLFSFPSDEQRLYDHVTSFKTRLGQAVAKNEDSE